MAAQQTLFAETIRGMKLAMRRRKSDSDSESSIHVHTNRSSKLKRGASYVREGRLDTTGGRSYRDRVEHAGYHRYIIHQNPPRLDDDGDVIEPEDLGNEDDEEEEEELGSPAAENPFNDGTKLEYLLAPLTSASELANHPSLSIPYTSRSLTEMADNARELVYREKEALWRAKQMLQKFRGDEMWIPLETMETYQDSAIFDPTDQPMSDMDPSVNDSSMSLDQQIPAAMETTQTVPRPATNGNGLSTQDGEVNGIKAMDMAVRRLDKEKRTDEQGVQDAKMGDERLDEDPRAHTKGNATSEQADVAEAMQIDGADPGEQPAVADAEPDAANVGNGIERDSSSDSTNGHVQHRMTTRAKARTTPSPAVHASPSPSPVPSSIPSVHPLFQFPAASLPDRDFGLPAQEAEDTRRVLVLYVQKQEQVVREAEDLLQGLLKADRLRKEVFKWCKAEGHVGEMSDGEDWYDMDEWLLDEPLKKGKEEEDVEEEGRGKRKGRRGAGKI